ncbi:TonB-dependent receptor domain-containing protein [Thiopseudomonas denitrificans]|uniref:Vitamin B12 transporter n=1 Tax=Thiopseudomonas denitrificans TaxID=1501432 RepID=A0A4V3D4T8_9GAMM|nr:TonB-dependent receptor [Thiopseudomonas denitrificans]TDQ37517.1 vitamin B12 transporter [Thiopseudomonas denitrificans]
MKLSRLALAVAALPLVASAATDLDTEAALKLSDTVITANRGAQSKADTTAAVSVFTREDIDRLQPVNVADLLNRVPGVQIRQNGGRGSATGVFIRGTSTAQTLVLIDGVRVGSATAGGANGALEHLNIDQIERVEVLRGSRSAVYGADAIGGVIQIFTRRGDGQGLTPRVRYAIGNKGVQERSIGLSGGNEKTNFSFGLSLDDDKGFDRTTRSDSADKDHDTYRNKSVSLALDHKFNEQFSVGATLLEQHAKSEYDSAGLGANAKYFSKTITSSASVFSTLQITDFWKTRLELGHSQDKLAGYDKLSNPKHQYDINTYRNSIGWLNTISLNKQNELLLGVDYHKDKVRSTTDYDKKDRWNQAGFAQHRFTSDWFNTELGLRHDNNQHYGSRNSWNAALTVPVNPDNSLSLSYAEGFRAPTFNDLFYPEFCDPLWGCFPSDSNPNLKPETSKTYELRWSSRLTDIVSLEASAYRTNIRNAILKNTTLNKLENIDNARINGFEASVIHQFATVRTALNLSFIDARDRDSERGNLLPARARRTISFDVDKQLGNFSAGATWRASSHSFQDADNDQRIAGYGIVDLRGSWAATEELNFGLRLGNIFDKKYSRAVYPYGGKNHGYREDRATIQASVTWTPKLF